MFGLFECMQALNILFIQLVIYNAATSHDHISNGSQITSPTDLCEVLRKAHDNHDSLRLAVMRVFLLTDSSKAYGLGLNARIMPDGKKPINILRKGLNLAVWDLLHSRHCILEWNPSNAKWLETIPQDV
jgi:hypothetical protein